MTAESLTGKVTDSVRCEQPVSTFIHNPATTGTAMSAQQIFNLYFNCSKLHMGISELSTNVDMSRCFANHHFSHSLGELECGHSLVYVL